MTGEKQGRGITRNFHWLVIPALMAAHAAAQGCAGDPLAVQILGSGGPALNPSRASASYLLWSGGRARILVDAGGGAFLRFGQAQAKFEDLSLIAITHLHPDHTSDLPALLWAGRTAARNAPLPISGPSGNSVAPSLSAFLSRLFDRNEGAFQVLASVTEAGQGGSGGLHLAPTNVDVAKDEPTKVFEGDGMTVTALRIPHDRIPALAYRVTMQGVAVVFSTDQIGTDPKFVDFARGANVLVMHMAIAAGATSTFHAAPAVVGRVAQAAGVGRLIVSHIGPFDLDAALAELQKSYKGPLTVGADLLCTAVH